MGRAAGAASKRPDRGTPTDVASRPIPEAASGGFVDAQRVEPRLGCRAALEKSEGQLRVAMQSFA